MARKSAMIVDNDADVETPEFDIPEVETDDVDGDWVETNEDLNRREPDRNVTQVRMFRYLKPSKEMYRTLLELKKCGSLSRIRFVGNQYIATDDKTQQECVLPFHVVAERYFQNTGKKLKRPVS